VVCTVMKKLFTTGNVNIILLGLTWYIYTKCLKYFCEMMQLSWAVWLGYKTIMMKCVIIIKERYDDHSLMIVRDHCDEAD
jgi:hypothetical protein